MSDYGCHAEVHPRTPAVGVSNPSPVRFVPNELRLLDDDFTLKDRLSCLALGRG